jgi:hypothetical protein
VELLWSGKKLHLPADHPITGSPDHPMIIAFL